MIIQEARDLIKEKYQDDEYLLYCLIIAAAKVQSSTGHQNGYLKKFSLNSLRDIDIIPIDVNICGNEDLNNVYFGDIFSHIGKYHDIFYFDPPYGTINHNVPVATRYSAFYHFWNTLILHDNPQVFGKANRRIDSKANTDVFEINKKNTFLPLIKNLFEKANGREVFVSLSNQSVVTKEDVIDYCGLDIKCYEQSHSVNIQGLKTKKEGKFSVEKLPLVEYLFHYEK